VLLNSIENGEHGYNILPFEGDASLLVDQNDLIIANINETFLNDMQNYVNCLNAERNTYFKWFYEERHYRYRRLLYRKKVDTRKKVCEKQLDVIKIRKLNYYFLLIK
jgi:hypothetical protein